MTAAKVLAIGATGFIGRPVVERLVGAGHEVAVLHRSGGNRVPHGAREIFASRDRLTESLGEIDEFGPDVTLDMILYTEQQAQELAEAMRESTGRLVAVSSADVYRNYDGLRGRPTAPPDRLPLLEDAPLRESRYPYRGQQPPPSEYSEDYDKILVEQQLLRARDLPTTILRLPAVYGPRDSQRRLRRYVRRMADPQASVVLDEAQANWRWTRGFVGNVAAAIALAVGDSRARGIYNVGEETALCEREWVERIGAATGWRGAVTLMPAADLPEHLRQPLDWQYGLWTDTTRLRRELGFVEPIQLDEALRITVDWEMADR